MLTPTEAADIAAEAGLGIADAAALLRLADDVDTARTIARKFAGSEEQRFAALLFADAERGRTDIATDTDPTAKQLAQLFDRK